MEPNILMEPTIVVAARSVIRTEAEALRVLSDRFGPELQRAIELIQATSGKLVTTGVGKSGHIARSLAATFASTGTPAAYLHASDALHGDLGMIQQGDTLLLISHGGSSQELQDLLASAPHVRRIGIIGNRCSPLASAMHVLLDASVAHEADPWNVVPTTSAVVALAIGHALAIALMLARGYLVQNFAAAHPAGELGRRLNRG